VASRKIKKEETYLEGLEGSLSLSSICNEKLIQEYIEDKGTALDT